MQIQEKNKELLHESRDRGMIQTQPERKPAITVEDDMRPAIVIGEFVMVDANTSPGNNRPGGSAFVESVRGVGAATTATIRYHGVENRKYNNIPLSALTNLVFGNTFGIAETKRKRSVEARQIIDPSPPKLYPNNKNQNGKRPLRMERFIEELKYGGRYNITRGWHRLRHYPPNQSKLMMSRCHSNLSRREGGMKMLTENEIWRAAMQVWEEIPCAKIASAYVQANRIARRVIKMGGSNDFLAVKGSISVGVRDDFQQTKHGLRRKDTLVFPAPPASPT